MIRPTREEFRALARDHTVVPVWREVLADLTTPVAAFLRIVGDEPGFLLEPVHGVVIAVVEIGGAQAVRRPGVGASGSC